MNKLTNRIIGIVDSSAKVHIHTDLKKTWFTIENKEELEKLLDKELTKSFELIKKQLKRNYLRSNK